MLNLPRFLFINGPPGSGKSTLATLLCAAESRCWRESFAEPIRSMIYSVFFSADAPGSHDFDLRDSATKKMFLKQLAGLDVKATGLTVRQTMINFSEGFMKPFFGEDIFGRLLYRRCIDQEHWYSHFIIDDSGFSPEAEYVISQVGPDSCYLIRLHRNGCNFAGDSRGYIDLPIRTLDLHNDGEPINMLTELQLAPGIGSL